MSKTSSEQFTVTSGKFQSFSLRSPHSDAHNPTIAMYTNIKNCCHETISDKRQGNLPNIELGFEKG